MLRLLPLLLVSLIFSSPLLADGPQDNQVENVRQIPPPGTELTAEERGAIVEKLDRLQSEVSRLRLDKSLASAADLIDDVEVFAVAVSRALRNGEFYGEPDVKNAHLLLDAGLDRAAALATKQPNWILQKGLVIRGYRSQLDGTIQPYGLEIGRQYDFNTPGRCDIWFHGRGEKSLELQFIAQRMKAKSQYPLERGIVLHPFGRYSNAFKFAGEVDVLEALEHVKRHYNIDDDRISVRGFSMGGAACWQFAVHTPDLWFAANPGAGFSETPEFLKSFQGETLNPPWYEERLWNWYDCPGWCENLRHVPTIAYSGEIDKQKQAADVMEAALREKGISLLHLIGPETAHKIHPDSAAVIANRFESLERGGRETFPHRIVFTTYTLKYNRLGWITVNSLEEHWRQSRIEAAISSPHRRPAGVTITTSGITDFSVEMPPGSCPFDVQSALHVEVDGQAIDGIRPMSDRSLTARFLRTGDRWKVVPADHEPAGLVKRHNLQGPVDDALMQPFLYVRPTGKFINEKVGNWVTGEMTRAVEQWNRHMRGDVRIKDDKDVTDEDLRNFNLILWGCPQSNSLLAKVGGSLPLKWTSESVTIAGTSHAAAHHAPIVVYPNPLNPDRYVVLNSSFTFREYDYLNNARQTPKLPDWAVIDLNIPPNSRWPGKVIDADFFDERWQVRSRE